jgi:hypothetical protein
MESYRYGYDRTTQAQRRINRLSGADHMMIKRQGKVVHQESQTFDRRQAASAWSERREAQLHKPGALGTQG